MLKKILVATDGSDHARKAVDYASDIAAKYQAKVYIIHAVPPVPRMAELGPDVLQTIEEGQKKYARQIIEEGEEEIKKMGIKNYQSDILYGDPVQEIIEFARKNDIDMIVMGSHGAGRIETFLLGSVSNKVCHLAECTCVTVK
jgi:nucleotide-binding universal stress UspA family protein